jgi:hypothetical protein
MRRLTAAVLAASLAVAGCAAEPTVSPLPVESAAAPAASASPSWSWSAPPPASRATSPVPAPAVRRTTRPAAPAPTTRPAAPPSSPACAGAVVHTIDLATDELALVPALCLSRGAVLRIEHIGPGEVTTDAPGLVEQRYEAGIVEIRFLRAGTVVVTIPQAGRPHDVPVVVR